MTNKKRGKKVLKPGDGLDLIAIVGLPKDVFNYVKRELDNDRQRRPVKIVGVPAPVDNWGNLYPSSAMNLLINQLILSLKQSDNIPTPRRIILCYVNGIDSDQMLEHLDYFTFSTAISPEENSWQKKPSESSIAWRHDKFICLEAVKSSIEYAISRTDSLKSEITDRNSSVFNLPPRNFFFPSSEVLIEKVYNGFRKRGFKIESADQELPIKKEFRRGEVNIRIFSEKQQNISLFVDEKGRIFPPDKSFHSRQRIAYEEENSILNGLLLLRQRYRFGVLARNGELHYDVQYPNGHVLSKEKMTCGRDGSVIISGSHANVGINDVIWTPDGTKTPDT